MLSFNRGAAKTTITTVLIVGSLFLIGGCGSVDSPSITTQSAPVTTTQPIDEDSNSDENAVEFYAVHYGPDPEGPDGPKMEKGDVLFRASVSDLILNDWSLMDISGTETHTSVTPEFASKGSTCDMLVDIATREGYASDGASTVEEYVQRVKMGGSGVTYTKEAHGNQSYLHVFNPTISDYHDTWLLDRDDWFVSQGGVPVFRVATCENPQQTIQSKEVETLLDSVTWLN